MVMHVDDSGICSYVDDSGIHGYAVVNFKKVKLEMNIDNL